MSDASQVDPLGDLVEALALLAEDALQPGEKRGNVRSEQAWFQVRQQAVHRQQCVGLVGAEPQAGQLITRAYAGLRETIAAGVPVVDDRGVEAVLQECEITLEGCPGNLELIEQFLSRDHLPGGQQLINPVEAVAAVHGGDRSVKYGEHTEAGAPGEPWMSVNANRMAAVLELAEAKSRVA